jgi:hypothetical protein
MPWALIMGGLLIGALLAGVGYWSGRLVHNVAEHQREHPGTFTVTACRYTSALQGYWTADCAGDFRSDDGTLAVSLVRVSLQQSSNIQLEPAAGMRWRAWLGRGDRTAKLSQNLVVMWGVPLTLDAVLLAWLVAQVVWFARRFRRRPGGTSRSGGMVAADG